MQETLVDTDSQRLPQNLKLDGILRDTAISLHILQGKGGSGIGQI